MRVCDAKGRDQQGTEQEEGFSHEHSPVVLNQAGHSRSHGLLRCLERPPSNQNIVHDCCRWRKDRKRSRRPLRHTASGGGSAESAVGNFGCIPAKNVPCSAPFHARPAGGESIPVTAGCIPEGIDRRPTNFHPIPAGIVCAPAGAGPRPAGIVPPLTRIVPKFAGTVPPPSGIVPKFAGTVTIPAGTQWKFAGAVTIPAGVVS